MSFGLTDVIGYIGSLIVVSSFFMKEMKYLRVINIVGCFVFICYGVLLNFSIPIIFTNTVIVFVNLYYLIRS